MYKQKGDTIMNRIVKILMERDDITEEEAKALIKDVREMMEDAIADGDYSEAEDIMAGELGLEMDYIMDILL